jgi:hypothetical protein
MIIVLHVICYKIPNKHGLLQYKTAKTPYSSTDRYLIYTPAYMWTHTDCETNYVKRNTH